MQATLGLEQVAWGTRLLLTCTYEPQSAEYDLPPTVDYTLFVRTREGRTEQVGSWRSVGDTLPLQIVGAVGWTKAAGGRLVTDGAARMVPLPIRPFRGDLPWPIQGNVVSRFGRAASGRFGTSIVRNGIEVSGSEGAEVKAVHEGTVAYAAPFTGFGTLVIVDHGGNAFTLYGHLAEAVVSAGTGDIPVAGELRPAVGGAWFNPSPPRFVSAS